MAGARPHNSAKLVARTVTALLFLAEPAFMLPSGHSPPLMLATDGCSGSSWILATIRKLLQFAADVKVCDLFSGRSAELLYQDINPDWQQGMTLAEALRANHARCAAANATLVFKGKEVTHALEHADAIIALGTRVAYTYRVNLIDYGLCLVMDCFARGLGTQVYRKDGSPSGRCFRRRRNPWRANSALAAKLNVSAFMAFLQHAHAQPRGQDVALLLESQGYGPKPIQAIAYEELALSGHTAGLMHISVAAFRRILRSFGHDVPEERITAVLAPDAGQWLKPSPHSKKVYNFEAFRSELSGPSVPLAVRAMLRTTT